MKPMKIIITLLKVLVVVLFLGFFFNGINFYRIPGEELEKKFLTKAEESGLKAGEITVEENHNNSRTFLFSNKDGETACASYVRSLYGDRWREVKFYSSKMGVFKENQISYEITDLYTGYAVHCDMSTAPKVTFGEATIAILSVKLFGVSIVLMAGFAGRLWGNRIFRKKSK